jgi:putative hemolysin
VCGAPAIDRAFGTIDFFVLFDVDALTRKAHQAFFGT